MAFGANDYSRAGIDAKGRATVVWGSLITGASVGTAIDATVYPTG